jgi:hypothetical protein
MQQLQELTASDTFHQLFLRGKPHLLKYMRRLPKTQKKIPMKKSGEPDFYALDKKSPLPPLQVSSSPTIFNVSIATGALSPRVQQQFPPLHLVTPPVLGLHSNSPAAAQSFTPDLLNLFDDTNVYVDSLMNPIFQVPLNSSRQNMEPVHCYLGRGVSMLPTPTPLATESFCRLQEQQREQEESKQLTLQQHYMQPLQQLPMHSNVSFDYGSAFEPQGDQCIYSYTSSQHNLY